MNRRRQFLSLVAAPLIIVLVEGQATAQGLVVAEAEALFNKGITELEAGHYDTACAALAESHRLDPQPGALFALADCQDKGGRIATAVVLYEEYLHAVAQMKQASKQRHHERGGIARARRVALAAEIPELTLVLPALAHSDVRIVRDGIVFMPVSLGVAQPIDPGEHVVTTQVGDGPAFEHRITLARGEKKTVELEVKLSGPAERLPAPGPVARNAPSEVNADPVGVGMGDRRISAIVVGGVGVAGLVLGGVTGLMALSRKSVIEEHCQGAVCDDEGADAADAAKLSGLLSTVGFGVGAAGLAAGLVLWLTGTPADSGPVKPRLRATWEATPGRAVLGVKGVW